MFLVAVWNSTLQSGSNAYVPQSSNMLQESQSSTSSQVPLMVTNGFHLGYPRFSNNPYNGIPNYDAELDEANAALWQLFWPPPS